MKMWFFVVCVLLMASSVLALGNSQSFQILPHKDGCKIVENSRVFQHSDKYLFKGEQMECVVLVADSKGVPNDVKGVYASLAPKNRYALSSSKQKCQYLSSLEDSRFSAADFNLKSYDALKESSYGVYKCIVKVGSCKGLSKMNFVAVNRQGKSYTAVDRSWNLNPRYGIKVINGPVDFGGVAPGKTMYSKSITILNTAPRDSEILLNLFISGSDAYDMKNPSAKCPSSNVLELKNIGYWAMNGAFHTSLNCGNRNNNLIGEGYLSIPYETGRKKNREEILECNGKYDNGYPVGNLIVPGGKVAITFAVAWPYPCIGNFDFSDSIHFWAEPI
ncbi:hypothetical protein JXA85_07970 [Candidatus Woesearchaeota archaeon]|nr:hypothetical protein [Candidatus Woesearchaeota archaeon]